MQLGRRVLSSLVTISTAIIVAILFIAQPVPALAEEPDSAGADVPPEHKGRWIEVDLTHLVATAWEGNQQVYQALVSAGRAGYETPTGTFHILRRVANETMDSSTYGIRPGMPGYYVVKNVRYTQYITNNGIALHANYWSPRSVFGHRNDSHGCIGMTTEDAAWFWNWATVGTPVIVHYSDKVAVPPVVGSMVDTATADLAAAGLQAQTKDERNDAPAGQVVAQSPDAGTLVEPAAAILLTVSLGPVAPVRPPEGNWAWVPEIAGLPEAEARQRLDEAGLNTGYTNYQTEADIPADALPLFQRVRPGCVLSSSFPEGSQLPRGTVVQIAVRKP